MMVAVRDEHVPGQDAVPFLRFLKRYSTAAVELGA